MEDNMEAMAYVFDTFANFRMVHKGMIMMAHFGDGGSSVWSGVRMRSWGALL